MIKLVWDIGVESVPVQLWSNGMMDRRMDAAYSLSPLSPAMEDNKNVML